MTGYDHAPTNDRAPIDVAIVGAGPTGLTLAILLAQAGRSVVILERQATPYGLPRAVHFDNEVGRILQGCGIGDELRRIIEPGDLYEWRAADGTPLLRFGRTGDTSTGWPGSSMFCQPDLEDLLRARAGQLPGVELRLGAEVTDLAHESGTVAVGLADGSAVDARFVIGCDGANSTVRDLTGIEMVDRGFFYDWLIVDIVLDDERVFDPINLQICDPARPTTAVSGGPGRRRWEFMALPDESLDELGTEARSWELLASWDVRPDNARLERHAVYRFQARHAERWRADGHGGRVFLAGDAAHQMPPFAGQGMCAGIRDAANLAWKLDAALDLAGDSADALLATYEQERRPSARAAIDFSMELGKVICVPDPAEAAARDAAMAAGVTDEPNDVPDLPGIDDGFLDAATPAAGGLVPQGTLDGRPADDVTGGGWVLFTDGTASTPEPTGVDLTVVDLASSSNTEVREWLASHDATTALQRPDFHLYGLDRDPAALLERFTTHLDPRSSSR